MVFQQKAVAATAKKTRAERADISQVAALCHRKAKAGREVLLVTSSNGRWILPKGWPMDDRSDAKAAKLEAWEEAGVKKGNLEPTPVGSFIGQKAYANGSTALCDTTVYAIEVEKTVKDFPEADARERKWVPLEDAPDAVDDPQLSDFLRTLRAA